MLTPLCAIAAYGVAHESPIVDEPLDDRRWRQLLGNVTSQRLDGLASRAAFDGSLAVTDFQLAEITEREVAGAARSLLLERALIETMDVLSSVEVPFRGLKGPAVAHLDYPDPALRLFGDIDILLRATDFDRGVEALLDAGCTRPVPELAPGFDRRFGKGATLRRPDGVEVDVHRILVAGTFGLRFDSNALFDTVETFEIGGRAVPALGRVERFLHACFHAALGNPRPRLMSVRDVGQMVTSPHFDWPAALLLAQRRGAEAPVERALRLCTDLLGVGMPPEIASWLARFTPSPRDSRAVEACLREDGRFAQQAIDAVRDVRGVRAKLDYVRALTLPQGTHLAGRGRGRLGHLVRGAGRLRGRKRR